MPSEADQEQMERLQAWNVSMSYNGKAVMNAFIPLLRYTSKTWLTAVNGNLLGTGEVAISMRCLFRAAPL